ncbi:MAG: VanZ family protein [Eubacterium sp.]|nr:VanZ family protein [Eubacterium sp.]
MMKESVAEIIKNVLKAVYQPFLFALVLSVFVLFFLMFIEKYNKVSIKDKIVMAFKEWKDKFLSQKKFRRAFYLVFFSVMVLFKTLLNRDMWANPVSDVIGVWGLHRKDGTFTTEMFENVVLFIPLVFFLFFFLETTSKRTSKFLIIMGKSMAFSFLISLTIEMLQLFLRLGTWQLSDICFNLIGGIIGGLIYWLTAKIRRI